MAARVNDDVDKLHRVQEIRVQERLGFYKIRFMYLPLQIVVCSIYLPRNLSSYNVITPSPTWLLTSSSAETVAITF